MRSSNTPSLVHFLIECGMTNRGNNEAHPTCQVDLAGWIAIPATSEVAGWQALGGGDYKRPSCSFAASVMRV